MQQVRYAEKRGGGYHPLGSLRVNKKNNCKQICIQVSFHQRNNIRLCAVMNLNVYTMSCQIHWIKIRSVRPKSLY